MGYDPKSIDVALVREILCYSGVKILCCENITSCGHAKYRVVGKYVCPVAQNIAYRIILKHFFVYFCIKNRLGLNLK